MKIDVDVDGVLLNTMELFCEIYNERNHTNYSIFDVKRWEFFRDWDIKEEEIYALLHEIFKLTSGVPLTDAAAPDVMRKLNKDHEVYILSARNRQFKHLLLSILESHDLKKGKEFDKIYLVPEKPYDVKLIHSHDILIDDNPYLVESIKNHEKKYLLLYDQPWNKNCTCIRNVFRVKNWKEIFNIIQKIDEKHE